MNVQLARRAAVAVLAALAALGAPGAGTAFATARFDGSAWERRCSDPAGGEDFASLSPADADIDLGALQELLDWAGSRNSASVKVYRHGCLIGTSRMDAVTQDLPRQWQSASKAVNALVVGRAVQLGLVSLSDPVSRWPRTWREAEAAALRIQASLEDYGRAIERRHRHCCRIADRSAAARNVPRIATRPRYPGPHRRPRLTNPATGGQRRCRVGASSTGKVSAAVSTALPGAGGRWPGVDPAPTERLNRLPGSVEPCGFRS